MATTQGVIATAPRPHRGGPSGGRCRSLVPRRWDPGGTASVPWSRRGWAMGRLPRQPGPIAMTEERSTCPLPRATTAGPARASREVPAVDPMPPKLDAASRPRRARRLRGAVGGWGLQDGAAVLGEIEFDRPRRAGGWKARHSRPRRKPFARQFLTQLLVMMFDPEVHRLEVRHLDPTYSECESRFRAESVHLCVVNVSA